MSISMLDERPISVQKNSPDSYLPSHSCVSSEYGSGKKLNKDQCRGGDGCDSPHSAPKDQSDQDSAKSYGGSLKDCGNNLHSNHTYATHGGSLKHFVNDHSGEGRCDHTSNEHENARVSCKRNISDLSSLKESNGNFRSSRNVEDVRDSGDCGYGGHCSGIPASHDAHRDRGSPKGHMRPVMSWLDRRSFHVGDQCAPSLDWDSHPTLRHVPPDEHQNFRHSKLEEWLLQAHKRRSDENFGAYIWRASALANSELRHRKKQCWGDEYGNPFDKFVMRLFYGMKLKLERTESFVLGVDDETSILNILREECAELSKSGQLPFDQRSIQYTPLIMSEMQERSINGRY